MVSIGSLLEREKIFSPSSPQQKKIYSSRMTSSLTCSSWGLREGDVSGDWEAIHGGLVQVFLKAKTSPLFLHLRILTMGVHRHDILNLFICELSRLRPALRVASSCEHLGYQHAPTSASPHPLSNSCFLGSRKSQPNWIMMGNKRTASRRP